MRALLLNLLLLVLLAPPSSYASETVYDLVFHDLRQQTAPLERYRGKVLLLNFWATWCPPCVREMPSMARLQQHFEHDRFAVVAVNVGESPEAVEAFRRRIDTALDFEILLDEPGQAFRELGIPGLPMTYLYDREGRRVDTVAGGHEWDSPARIAQIEALLR